MDILETIGAGVLRLLREGPAGGLVLGLVGCIVMLRLLLKEKDAKLEAWITAARIADTYSRLIDREADKAAAREARLLAKTEGRGGGGGKAKGGGDAPESGGQAP